MKSPDEIKQKLKELFPDAGDIKVRTSPSNKNKILVELSAMYGCPGRDLKKMIALGEFVGTLDIDEVGTFASPGCETCDYGSRYGVELEITLPEKQKTKEP